MPAKAKGTVIFLVILTLIAHLLILYFIKYHNQNLSIKSFNLLVTGNLINLAFTFLLLSGIIIYAIRNKRNPELKGIIRFTIVTTFFLLLCLLTLYIKIPVSGIYIFEQTLSKFIVGFLFALFQFVQFMFISYVWLRIFTEKNFISLRIIFNSVIFVVVLLLAAYFYIEIKMKNYNEKWNIE